MADGGPAGSGGHSPVGAAGSVPVTGGEVGLVRPLHKRLRLGAPGSPDGTHLAATEEGGAACQPRAPGAQTLGRGRGLLWPPPPPRSGQRADSPRPEDVLRATHCQHQEPPQKQLPGVTHGPCVPAGWPSPDGGLEHKAQPPKSLCRPLLEPVPLRATAPWVCDTRPAQPLPQQESPKASASPVLPQPVSAGEAGPLPVTGAQDQKPAPSRWGRRHVGLGEP